MGKFESITKEQLDTIYKKELNIFEVRTRWADYADCVQSDYIYVLTTLTHDQLAYYLVNDYDLPIWDNNHGYSNALTAGFHISKFEPKADPPFHAMANVYRELLTRKQSNSENIEKLLIMDPDKEKLAQDPEYAPIDYIRETDNWEKALNYLATLRDQELKEMQKKQEQKKANQQMSDIIKQISKMSVNKKQEILKQLIK